MPTLPNDFGLGEMLENWYNYGFRRAFILSNIAWISASPLSEANLPSACTAADDRVRGLRTSGWGRLTGAMRISMRSIPNSPSSLNESSNCCEIIRIRVAKVALEHTRIKQ